jgi:hypothetical protein
MVGFVLIRDVIREDRRRSEVAGRPMAAFFVSLVFIK